MGIFGKTVDTYTVRDVEELLGVSESIILEFKRKVDTDQDLLKELVAFTNTFGGWLVIGAEEKNSALHALPGVPPVNGFQQKVTDLCLTQIVPPIVPYPSPAIDVPNSKNVLYVIHAPASLSGPHFLVGRKGAYVRVSEHNKPYEPRLAEWEELSQLAQRRERTLTLRQSLRDRAVQRARTKMPGDAVVGEIQVAPAYPALPLVEIGKLSAAAEKAKVQSRGVPYPRGEAQPLHESIAYTPFPDKPQEYYVETTVFGSTFAAVDLTRKVEQSERVPIRDFLAYILVWLVFGRRFLREIGYEGPVLVSGALRGIRDRNFIWDPETWFSNPYESKPRFDEDVYTETEISTVELKEGLNRIALSLFLPLAYACGFEWLLRQNRDEVIGNAVQYLGWTLEDIIVNR